MANRINLKGMIIDSVKIRLWSDESLRSGKVSQADFENITKGLTRMTVAELESLNAIVIHRTK